MQDHAEGVVDEAGVAMGGGYQTFGIEGEWLRALAR